jgi:hypothetical protein
LRLDDENVIALKSLADINERQERYGEAETWLRRLVAIDRSNDEAREQLERVEAARQSGVEQVAAVSQTPEDVPAEPSAPSAPLEMIDLTPEPDTARLEPAPASPEPAALPPEPASLERVSAAELEPLMPQSVADADAEPGLNTVPAAVRYEAPGRAEPASEEIVPPSPAAEAPLAPLELEQSGTPEEPVQPLPGLISAEFQPPLEAVGGLGVETSEEVVLEVSGRSEFQVPDASEDLKSVAARTDAPPPSARPAEDPEPPSRPAKVPPKVDQEPEFVVTETMGEVLLQQGYSEEALRVFRELARRNEGSPELEARIRELESGPVGQPPMRPSYLARDTHGQSVGAFFHALLSSRVPGHTDPVTRETSRVDGAASGSGQNGAGPLEASYGGEQSLPAPPAVPSSEAHAETVSFDDFFNSESGESTSTGHGKGEPGTDDLDQFQTWLQNLKR